MHHQEKQHTLPPMTNQAKYGCPLGVSTHQLQELKSAGVSTRGRESQSTTGTQVRVNLGMHHNATHTAP
jgi:hypothetical protein